MLVESVDLHFEDGRSDKVYNVQLEEVTPGRFVVNFQYGRRGSTLKSGTKTASPVGELAAREEYEKVVGEKTRKGYRAVGASTGTGFTPPPTTAVKVEGLDCQLMNPLSEEELEDYLQNDDWGLQEKIDGERLMAEVDGAVVGANRKGLQKALPVALEVALAEFESGTTFDGEQIGDNFYVFDLLSVAGRKLHDTSVGGRYTALKTLLSKQGSERVKLVRMAVVEAEKRAMFERVRSRGGEGVVFKRLSAAYSAGRPASGGDWRKFKFVEDASCVVLGQNGTVRSVRLGMFSEDGVMVEVGNVTIPPNADIPEAGAIVDVQYLYAYRGGSLYQPVYKKVRNDVGQEAAVMSRLKYKSEEETALA